MTGQIVATIRRYNEATDAALPWLDNTRATAINTCNRWGIVTYIHSKVMTSPDRLLAPEAGAAMHRFFAAWNAYDDSLPLHHVFKPDELAQMHEAAEASGDPKLSFAMEALYLSSYCDSAADNKRTLVNMENACRKWADFQTGRAHKVLAVEVKFRYVLTLEYQEGCTTLRRHDLVYCGAIDAVCENAQGAQFPIDYKTTSRINDAYDAQWHLNPQLTGYWLYLKLLEHEDGVCVAPYAGLEAILLPVPRESRLPVHTRDLYDRTDNEIDVFNQYVFEAMDVWTANGDTPWAAAPNPISCNRYFRPCSMLPFCRLANDEERKDVFMNEMVTHEWNPLNEH